MKRWTAGVATLALTTGTITGVAGTASAAYPGVNDSPTFYDGSTWSNAGPLHDPANDMEFDPATEDPTNNTAVFPDGGAAWSPSGRTLFIVGEQVYIGAGVIRVAPAEGTIAPIADVDTGTRLSVSPDGKQVAITSGGDVKIINSTTGSLVRNLTPNLLSTVERDPAWSPTNTGIAYTASDGIRIRPPAGGASRLWKKGAHQPDYSPDGTKIAYLTSTNVLHYANASTGGSDVNTTIVVKGAYDVNGGEFTWSPDGKQFLFTGTGSCVLATTTGKVTAHPGSGGCTSVAWRKKQ